MIEDYLDRDLNKLTKIPVKRKRGIYFLYNKEELVYIGQSIHISSRVCGEHLKSDKKFDSYRYIEVDDDTELDRLELLYILEYNPKYNKNSLGNGIYSKDLSKGKKFEKKKKSTKITVNIN